MNAKVNEHFPNPAGIPETYKRPSLTVSSPNNAGGEVPVGQYVGKSPAPVPPTVDPAPTRPGTTSDIPAHWRR